MPCMPPTGDWLPECLAPWNCVPSAQRPRVSGWDIAAALGSTSASPACTSCARAGATSTRMSTTNTSFPTRWEIAHPLKQSLVRPAHIYRPSRGVYLPGGAVIMVRVSGTNGYILWPAVRVHLIFFIRDIVKLGLVLSLLFSENLTSFVPYLSLVIMAKLWS